MTKDEHPVSIGELLRARRREQGLSLEEVATGTRIRLSHLQALEEGRFEDLPGEAYRRGFLRSYAGALGLDPQVVLERYLSEVDQERATPVLSERAVEFPAEVADGGRCRWPFRWLIIALLLAAGLWWLQAVRDRKEEDRSTNPADRKVVATAPNGEGAGPAMEAATGAAGGNRPTLSEPASAPVARGGRATAGQDQAGADETVVQAEEKAGTSAVKQAQPQDDEEFRAALPPGGSRVKLQTLERCSIQVKVDDQAPRRYDLPAGAVLRWPVRDSFELDQERPRQVKLWVGDRTLDLSTARRAVLGRSSADGGGDAQ